MLAHALQVRKPAHATFNVCGWQGEAPPPWTPGFERRWRRQQPLEYAPPNPVISTSRLAARSAYRFRQTPHHHRLYAQLVHFHERGQPSTSAALPVVSFPRCQASPGTHTGWAPEVGVTFLFP